MSDDDHADDALSSADICDECGAMKTSDICDECGAL